MLNEGDKYAGFTLVCADKRNGAEPRLVLGTNSHFKPKAIVNFGIYQTSVVCMV